VKEGHICSYYEDDEPDRYSNHYEIIKKEKRIIELPVAKYHDQGGRYLLYTEERGVIELLISSCQVYRCNLNLFIFTESKNRKIYIQLP
jgi:hypothetical protein